jgi:hypothetical protein
MSNKAQVLSYSCPAIQFSPHYPKEIVRHHAA